MKRITFKNSNYPDPFIVWIDPAVKIGELFKTLRRCWGEDPEFDRVILRDEQGNIICWHYLNVEHGQVIDVEVFPGPRPPTQTAHPGQESSDTPEELCRRELKMIQANWGMSSLACLPLLQQPGAMGSDEQATATAEDLHLIDLSDWPLDLLRQLRKLSETTKGNYPLARSALLDAIAERQAVRGGMRAHREFLEEDVVLSRKRLELMDRKLITLSHSLHTKRERRLELEDGEIAAGLFGLGQDTLSSNVLSQDESFDCELTNSASTQIPPYIPPQWKEPGPYCAVSAETARDWLDWLLDVSFEKCSEVTMRMTIESNFQCPITEIFPEEPLDLRPRYWDDDGTLHVLLCSDWPEQLLESLYVLSILLMGNVKKAREWLIIEVRRRQRGCKGRNNLSSQVLTRDVLRLVKRIVQKAEEGDESKR